MSSVITEREPPIGLSRSMILVVLPKRVLPFLPPGVSSCIGMSRSIRPARRRALDAMVFEPDGGAEADISDMGG
jgi:hypothetical protein